MTKEIPLTQGQVALVDDDMYEYLMQWKWFANYDGWNWYAARNGPRPFQKKISMHRIIISSPDDMQVDHINRNGLDNRRENLRLCTNAQNSRNRGMQKHNTTGFNGVSWRKARRKYQARIIVNGKIFYLGHFTTAEEAAKAWDEAAVKHFGEFANLNFPRESVQ